MILKLQHNHSARKPQFILQNLFPQQQPFKNSPQFLKELLYSSQSQLDRKSKKQIHEWTSQRQKKVYQSLLPNNHTNYLAVMFEKSNPSRQQDIKSLMTQREESIMDRIVNDEIQVKEQEDNKKKIRRIKNQLDGKINEMKKELGDFNNNKVHIDDNILNQGISRSKFTNQSMMVLEDFKKKQYWKDKEFSQEGKRIKSFLSKIKRQKSEIQSRFSEDLSNRFKKLQSTDQTEKKKIQQQRHKDYLENLQKQYKQKTVKRKEYFEGKQQKVKEIQNFLSSVSSKDPAHLRYEKDFKDFLMKEQESRQKALKEIKDKHPTYSPEQVQEHMEKYIQIKEKYNSDKYMKASMQQQIMNNRYEELKNLYHSDHHKALIDPKKMVDLSLEDLTRNRQKVRQYANTVKETFKPIVNERKRQEIINGIKMLELSNDPTKKKIVKANGVIQFEDKKESDAYEKGVSYLEQLRSLNEVNRSRISTSKRYEERSSSALQLTPVKKIDYLRQSRPSLNLKPTISDWKDLLQKKNYSTKDKLQRVMDRAESLQLHAKQKEVQLRNMKRQSDNAMEVKEQSDKYFMESIAARMVLLKDVVMK